MVVYTGENIPEFLSRGTGGFFKGKDPNVSITELETNWVENTCVVYIGKAGKLKNCKATGRNRTHRPIQRTARGTQTFRQSQRLKAEGISM